MLSEGDCNATPALRIQNYLQRRKRMTFEIHSDITNRSMTVAARAMRRVLRRKRSIIWAIFGWSVFLFNALLLIPFDGHVDGGGGQHSHPQDLEEQRVVGEHRQVVSRIQVMVP